MKIPVGTVTDTQVDEALKQSVSRDLRTNEVGAIDKFDPDTQRASIILYNKRIKPTYNGNPVFEDPPLIDVPIIMCVTMRGGLTQTISKGDGCKVFFNDTSLQYWKENTQTPLADDIYHSISYPCAIVFQGSQPIKNYDNEATTLWYNNADEDPISIVKLNATNSMMSYKNDNVIDLSDKKVTIKTSAGTITIDDNIVKIEASKVIINDTATIENGKTTITGTVELGSAVAEVLNKSAVMQVAVPSMAGGTYPVTIVSAGQTNVKA